MANHWIPATLEVSPPEPLVHSGHRGGKWRVLVVSERARTRSALRRALAGVGTLALEYSPRLSSALGRIERGEVDLILLDLDGSDPSWEALLLLLDQAPEVPLVATVEVRDEERAIEAVRLGAEDYLLRDHLTPPLLTRALRCAIERHRRITALRDLSLTDPLTGLHNRRGFAALAGAQLRLTRRTRRRLLILCADLDDLKRINDAHGHPEGDRALVLAARLLRGCFRESDLVARVGGDEFAALAHETSEGAARALTSRIGARLEAMRQAHDLPYRLSLSLGAEEFDGSHDASLAELMAGADARLYRDKRERDSRGPGR